MSLFLCLHLDGAPFFQSFRYFFSFTPWSIILLRHCFRFASRLRAFFTFVAPSSPRTAISFSIKSLLISSHVFLLNNLNVVFIFDLNSSAKFSILSLSLDVPVSSSVSASVSASSSSFSSLFLLLILSWTVVRNPLKYFRSYSLSLSISLSISLSLSLSSLYPSLSLSQTKNGALKKKRSIASFFESESIYDIDQKQYGLGYILLYKTTSRNWKIKINGTNTRSERNYVF